MKQLRMMCYNLPVSWFPSRRRVVNLVQFPSETGIAPVKKNDSEKFEATQCDGCDRRQCSHAHTWKNWSKTDSKCSCSLKIKRVCLSLAFDYRKDCIRSTATPSMPAGPPLALGIWAQISGSTFAHRSSFAHSRSSFAHRFHFRPKSPPRARSTLKVPPTAKEGMKEVVSCLGFFKS